MRYEHVLMKMKCARQYDMACGLFYDDTLHV